MILTLKNVAKCKQCGSSNTVAELLIPSKKPGELRGRKGKESAEIRCRECGKINRTKIEIEIR